jgi:hypothetical protein
MTSEKTALLGNTLTQEEQARIEAIKNNIYLAIALGQNFARDWVWGAWSQEQWDFAFVSTPQDFGINGQWGPQFFWGSLSAIASTVISAGACKVAGKEIPYKEMTSTLVGTMAAIIPWNAGQYLGMTIGQANGWSQVNSALFASYFTGTFEGITQFLTIKLTKALADPEERAKFCANPKEYLKALFDKETLAQFAKDFGYSITIGAIPGTVWQLVFTACGVAGISAAPTGLLIALAVGVCNFGVAKIEQKKLIQRLYTSVTSCGFFKKAPAVSKEVEQSTDLEETGIDPKLAAASDAVAAAVFEN